MKLADEIITLLSAEKSSLSDALLKTKVLLHKLGRKELAEWVNQELNGYSEKDSVPSYRVLPAQVLANFANIAYQFSSHPIPLGHLEKTRREMLERVQMRESLAVLEKYAEKPKGHLEIPIAMEWNGLLQKGLAQGYKIQRAWGQIGITSVNQILIQVRSRLLDFVLELNEKLKGDLDEEEIKQRSGSLDTTAMFSRAIFGANTTIVVGQDNKLSVRNINVQGNLSVLAEELRQHGVAEIDIQELETAIKKDEGQIQREKKEYGPAVKGWIQKMLTKAVDASWKIELGIASGVLATALQNYYGWP